jgi:hypothetical protein
MRSVFVRGALPETHHAATSLRSRLDRESRRAASRTISMLATRGCKPVADLSPRVWAAPAVERTRSIRLRRKRSESRFVGTSGSERDIRASSLLATICATAITSCLIHLRDCLHGRK